MLVPDPVIPFLVEARRREKAGTLFYRALAAEAELAGRPEEAERLNGLHADEQHHLSRLTARLLEVSDDPPEDLSRLPRPEVDLERWEEDARLHERDEVEFYREAGGLELDGTTASIVAEILASEHKHLEHLGGKWMPA